MTYYELPMVVELVAAIVGKMRIFDRELLRHSAGTEKQIGVSTTELLFLEVVASAPGIRLSQIADKLCVQQATSSNVMRSLADKDLIVKRPDPSDGRGVQLHLSPKGEDTITRGKVEVRGPLREAAANMSIEELAMLNHLLGKLTGKVTEISADAPKQPPTRPRAQQKKLEQPTA